MGETEVRLRPRYGRWRAASLLTVYVLMGIHVAHWKLADRTLAPLELNEVMHTLELGIVTAGFLFMLLALASVLIFGRFFCSWGCHILALEDLCAWTLDKLGMAPKPVRSRVLLMVPFGAMLYMFAWPQVTRVLEARPLPELVVFDEGQGWASFLTADFARNLPGPGIALLTFAVCGFLIVYVLGSRSFCHFACPYGAVFGLADRVAPGRIVSTGKCTACSLCTAACQSGIRVHEELAAFGTVVNPACLKDLDCIVACPDGRIGYGFTRPPLLRTGRRKDGPRKRYGFSWGEEGLMALVFLGVLATFRGLYGQVPFLLSLGIGAIASYITIVGLRLVRLPGVRFGRVQLKLAGRLTRHGRRWTLLSTAFALLVLHSGFVRFHEFVGHRAYERIAHASQPEAPARVQRAIEHLEWTRRWGLYARPDVPAKLGALYDALGFRHAESGDGQRALAAFAAAARVRPDHAPTHYNLAVMLAQMGRGSEAEAQYREAARLDPSDPEILNNLGFLLLERGDLDGAERCFRTAVSLRPDFAHPHFNLGRILERKGRDQEARAAFERAAQLDPRYAEVLSEAREGEARKP